MKIEGTIYLQDALDALQKDIRMGKSEDGEIWISQTNALLKLTMLQEVETEESHERSDS